MRELVYGVNDHYGRRVEIVAVEVEKRTAKQVLLKERSGAFGHNLIVPVEHACSTPQEAVAAYAARKRESMVKLREEADRFERLAALAEHALAQKEAAGG